MAKKKKKKAKKTKKIKRKAPPKRKELKPDGSFTRGPGGRPSAITEELIKQIGNVILGGNYAETACAMYGVPRGTMLEWLRRGSKEPDSIYGEFSSTLRKATAQSEVRDLLIIDNASQKGIWKASAWRLERRTPKRWGRKEQMTITQTDDNLLEDDNNIFDNLHDIVNGKDGDE